MKKVYISVAVGLMLMLLLAGCKAVIAPAPLDQTATPVATAADEPITTTTLTSQADLVSTLGNLSYTGLFSDKLVTLIDGTYTYTEVGVPAKPIVRLLDRITATGDLDGDGAEDAVALLEHDTTGTARFVFAVPVLKVASTPTPGLPHLLGDRIQLKSLDVVDGKVVVEYLAQGAGDGDCCPTWNVRSLFTLQGDTLQEESTEQLSKVSGADLVGATWRLVDLNDGKEPVLPGTELTLEFTGDQIRGSGGCNSYYAAAATLPDAPQTFSVGPITATEMACPEEISKQEAIYFARLAKAVLWGYKEGLLEISYEQEDNSAGDLLFEHLPVPIATTEETTVTEPAVLSALDAIPQADLELYGAASAASGSTINNRLFNDCLENVLPGGREFPLAEPNYNAKRPLVLDAFADTLANLSAERAGELDTLLNGKSAVEIQALMTGGQLTAVDLVTHYVDRIQRYDVNKLNSVIELNPDALAMAAQLDAERAAGAVRGPLHGIPVLLKDNIATGDQMHTTAGAYVLRNWQADRDAFLVQKLRDAGAIILGKANLSEWANYMDPCMPSGFSTVGGQTRHPYGPFDPLGSSSGSAVSVAADLTAVSIGSETSGSMIQPSRVNGVAALRPSQGLISRDHIIPLGPDLDTPGPIARSVTDLALMLTAMAGADENDPKTADATALNGVDFTQFLSLDQAKKLRVGVIVPSNALEAAQKRAALIEQVTGKKLSDAEIQTLLVEYVLPEGGGDPQTAIDALTKLGIEVVEIDERTLPPSGDTAQVQLPYSFNAGVADFFSKLASPAPIASLAEVVAINNEDLANRAPYGQLFLENSVSNATTAEEYARIRAVAQALAQNWMKTVLETNNVDILVSGMSYSGNAGAAGVPALTIPAGLDPKGEPQGIVLSGDYLSEPKLFALGYALEQAIQGRVAPNLDKTIAEIEAVTSRTAKPEAVIALETAYGAPSQAGFGSAVFYEPLPANEDLEQAALAKYRYFVGDAWERFGEDAWMGQWQPVYARPDGAASDIVAELRGIEDTSAVSSASLILDDVDNAARARAALAAVFDDPAVTEVAAYRLGDGEAMSGLLVAGRYENQTAVYLVFLLD